MPHKRFGYWLTAFCALVAFLYMQRSEHLEGIIIERQQRGQMQVVGRHFLCAGQHGVAQLPKAWMHILMLVQPAGEILLGGVRRHPDNGEVGQRA